MLSRIRPPDHRYDTAGRAADTKADAGARAALDARLKQADSEGTYAAMMAQGDELSEARVRAELSAMEGRDHAGEPPGAPAWKSPLALRPAVADHMVPDICDAGFLRDAQTLRGELAVPPAARARARELDFYVNGRLVGEFAVSPPAGMPETFRHHFEAALDDLPGGAPDPDIPLEAEICWHNRIVAAGTVATDPGTAGDWNGEFYRVREGDLVGWAVDRADRSRTVPVIFEIDGQEHPRLAWRTASFSSRLVRECAMPLAGLGDGRDHFVALRNAVTGRILGRSGFFLRVRGAESFLWRSTRTQEGDLLVTVLGYGHPPPARPLRVAVQFLDAEGESPLARIAPRPAETGDAADFRFEDGGNSLRLDRSEIPEEARRLRLEIGGLNGPSFASDPVALESLPPVDLPKPPASPIMATVAEPQDAPADEADDPAADG